MFRSLGKMNKCSCSSYEDSPVSLWSWHLVRRNYRSADGRAARVASGGLEGNAHPLCGQLSSDGVAGSGSVQPLPVAAGTVAGRRGLDCPADAVARSVFQRIFPIRVSEHRS